MRVRGVRTVIVSAGAVALSPWKEGTVCSCTCLLGLRPWEA